MEQVGLKDFGETLKNVGFALGGLLVMAALFGLSMIFIVGATAVRLWVREWILRVATGQHNSVVH